MSASLHQLRQPVLLEIWILLINRTRQIPQITVHTLPRVKDGYPGHGLCTIIHIVTDDEVTIENYFPEVGNIPPRPKDEDEGNISN